MLDRRIRGVFTLPALVFACAIFACYFFVLPFYSGFDPCLSTILASQDIAAIRTRYQEFHALTDSGKYDQAYQYTTFSYQSRINPDSFEVQLMGAGIGLGYGELRADSSLAVCGDQAYLSIAHYRGGFGYGPQVTFSKLVGEWYIDDLRFSTAP